MRPAAGANGVRRNAVAIAEQVAEILCGIAKPFARKEGPKCQGDRDAEQHSRRQQGDEVRHPCKFLVPDDVNQGRGDKGQGNHEARIFRLHEAQPSSRISRDCI